MSDRQSRDPRPLVERLVPEVFAGTHHSPVMSTFLRGVTTGALVGAAIAGSALWSRYRRGRGSAPESVVPSGGDKQERQAATGD
jgi:hypothetical protein